MLAAVNGYYDGDSIVLEEDISLSKGQKVIVTILDTVQRKEGIDIDRYIGRGKKMFQSDAQDYVRELRENDRLLESISGHSPSDLSP